MIDRLKDLPPQDESLPAPAALAELKGSLLEFAEDGRPLYAATPLNPYERREQGGQAYILMAYAHVEAIFRENMEKLETLPSDAVARLLETSLYNALFSQVGENEGKVIPHNCSDDMAELFKKACSGEASVGELISLFSRYPRNLQSIELAKQTHPFDWSATERMDAVVEEALLEVGFTMPKESDARYYFMSSDDKRDPSALMLVRKVDVGLARQNDDILRAVQRDTVVLDLAMPHMGAIRQEVAQYHKALDNKTDQNKNDKPEEWVGGVKLPFTGAAAQRFMDEQYRLPVSMRSPALSAGVRSYYATFSHTD